MLTKHGACIGENRNADMVLVGKPDRKTPLGRPRHRWDSNITTVLQK
jgi:hypothetical protein